MRYTTVTTWPKLVELLAVLSAASKVAIDTENSGLRIYDTGFQNAGISFAVDPYRAWYLPLGHKTGKQLDRAKTIKLLASVLASKKYIFHNASYDRRVLSRMGIELPIENMVLDTVFGFYAIDERWNRSLKEVSNPDSVHWRMYGYSSPSYDERFGYRGERNRKEVQNACTVDIEEMSEYASNDARVTYSAYLWCRDRLNKDAGAVKLVRLENRFSACASEMEDTGYNLDVPLLQQIGIRLRAELDRLENELKVLTKNPEFDPKKRGHIRDYLYVQMKLEGLSGGTSTDKAHLKALLDNLDDDEEYTSLDDEGIEQLTQGSVIRKFLETFKDYSKKEKLESTYTGALLEKVSADGRIHTSYNQVGTDTGRSSSRDPNMQQLPKLEPGYEQFDIRSAFVAPDGYRVILADHEGQEMVVMAMASGCPVLSGIVTYRHKIQASAKRVQEAIEKNEPLWVLQNPDKVRIENKTAGQKFLARIAWWEDGKTTDTTWAEVTGPALQAVSTELVYDKIDIHKFTAFQTPGLECPYWDVSKEQRQNSKAVNFGIIFGQQAFGLAKRLGVAEKVASAFISSFMTVLHGVGKFIDESVRFAKDKLYTETLFNRRRHSGKKEMAIDKGGEVRALQNHRIQGSAADVFKKCVIKLQDMLDAAFPDRKKTGSVLLLGQIHDEVHVLCRVDLLPRVVKIVEEAMSFYHSNITLHAGADVKKTLSKMEKPETNWVTA